MAYVSGDRIAAADLNSLIGIPTGIPINPNKALRPFINSTEANNTVAGIYGVGYGDRGYGQIAENLLLATAGNRIKSTEWTALRNAISKCGDHQGTSMTNLVLTSNLEVGDTIVAHDGNNNPGDSLSDLVPTIDSNRLNTDSGASMTLASNAQTSSRTSSWSGDINAIFKFQWNDTNEARYFFNSGGEIRIRLTQTTNSTPQDADWIDIVNNKFTMLTMKANSSSITGSATSDSISRGYYDLDSNYSLLFNGLNIGSGVYSANDLIIDTRCYIAGEAAGATDADNGGPSNTVNIRCTLRDQHVGITGGPDTVSAGMTYRTDIFRATAELSGIAAPTINVVNSLS